MIWLKFNCHQNEKWSTAFSVYRWLRCCDLLKCKKVVSTNLFSLIRHVTMSKAGFRLACRFHRLITICRFRVAPLSGHAALAFSPRSIAPKLNRSQLSVICRCGQSGEDIDWLAWRCLPLDLPSAASGAFAVEQISPSKRQCGERQASLKAAYNDIPNNHRWCMLFISLNFNGFLKNFST